MICAPFTQKIISSIWKGEFQMHASCVLYLIIDMKKLLDSEWLRGVQVYRNTAPKMKYSAKNEIQCQKWHSVPKNEIQCQKMKLTVKKWNTAPKMKYSAKNGIQCQKWHSVPKNEIQCQKMKLTVKNEINGEKWNTWHAPKQKVFWPEFWLLTLKNLCIQVRMNLFLYYFVCILLISNSIWFLVQFGKTDTRAWEFRRLQIDLSGNYVTSNTIFNLGPP